MTGSISPRRLPRAPPDRPHRRAAHARRLRHRHAAALDHAPAPRTCAPSPPNTARPARRPDRRADAVRHRRTTAMRTARSSSIRAALAESGVPPGVADRLELRRSSTRSWPRRSASPSQRLQAKVASAMRHVAAGPRRQRSALQRRATSPTGISAAPTQANLAAQVADPIDLVRGRAETPRRHRRGA